MTGFLLDTNVVSEAVKPRPDPGVLKWLDDTQESLLFLSVLTISELRKGINLLGASSRRQFLESWLERDLPARFAGRILAVDLEVAKRWGTIAGTDTARRSPLPVIDGLLAATALHHALTFVTRDSPHPAITDIDVLNPWTE